ncbi:homocysteine S-methyltransferase [Mitsuokella jalaludinii]|uniref:homocysteine S-methyltransferase n=1 Tax=Mitsuokella jalaludinii TaxID=187979 RepID=UPI0020D140BE|nr:homocysteine S-methyltransferase [Mitsuokella jalaludinii]MCQ1532041.1 homocysteine S-methyltransferase [Mitsuokella jalaludinii]MEE0482509.1 homocysteine S-methyltransferase [Mitsuokella jalaludinii]
MNGIARNLEKYPLLVLDGAFGTELARRGFDTNDELWSAKALFEKPELVEAVHRDYYEAGADVSTSASYQATVEGFEKKGFTREQAKELIVRSVRLVQQARDAFWQQKAKRAGRPQPLAAASVGPYGAYLADGSEYRGDYRASRAELSDFHAERLDILVAAEPDILACETLPLLDEALAILADLHLYPDMGAWISFSCKDEAHTCGGDAIADCARLLDKERQVTVIGVNCTAPQYVADLIRNIRAHTTKPVVVYPNTGETYDAVTKTWHGSPTPYRDFVRQWYEAGARLIGGCCRTTPDDIRGIAAFRASLQK